MKKIVFLLITCFTLFNISVYGQDKDSTFKYSGKIPVLNGYYSAMANFPILEQLDIPNTNNLLFYIDASICDEIFQNDPTPDTEFNYSEKYGLWVSLCDMYGSDEIISFTVDEVNDKSIEIYNKGILKPMEYVGIVPIKVNNEYILGSGNYIVDGFTYVNYDFLDYINAKYSSYEELYDVHKEYPFPRIAYPSITRGYYTYNILSENSYKSKDQVTTYYSPLSLSKNGNSFCFRPLIESLGYEITSFEYITFNTMEEYVEFVNGSYEYKIADDKEAFIKIAEANYIERTFGDSGFSLPIIQIEGLQ